MRLDYIKHIIAGFLISFGIAFLIQKLWLSELMLLSVVVTMIVGFGKELVWDKWLCRGTPEAEDLWFDLWGAMAGTILAYFIL